ncbi:MAG: rRNA maturation RNase YbeY [Treponema sp.]|nr:rRNA maturation RNase YbeY [Treponema sp.]
MNQIDMDSQEVPLPPWVPKVKTFVKDVLRLLKKNNWELSILFCNNRYIKDLNRRFRNIDEPTDILSFSLDPFSIEEAGKTQVHYPGDLVISLDALEENTRYFNVSADEELRRLLVHGILHLSGEDHATNDKTEPMLIQQEEILETLKEARIIQRINQR